MSEIMPGKLPETDSFALRESSLHYSLKPRAGDKSASSGEPSDCGIVLREEALKGHLNLRGDVSDGQLQKAVSQVLGLALPIEPGSYSDTADTRVYWLGPNEWLVVVEAGSEVSVEAQLREVLQGHYSIVDVSGGQTLINLSGKKTEMLLKKSSVYDFHPNNFPAGRCVQTTFAKAGALISKRADGSFDLVIRRSFADYVFRWINDAADEYGLALDRKQISPNS
jgi:sarcosine oxidase subunit gamma